MFCSQPNCSKLAVTTYAWPWGDPGASCADCLPALQRTAIQLDRVLSLTALLPAAAFFGVPKRSEDVETAMGLASEMEVRNTSLEREAEQTRQANLDLDRMNRHITKENFELRAELARARGDFVPVYSEQLAPSVGDHAAKPPGHGGIPLGDAFITPGELAELERPDAAPFAPAETNSELQRLELERLEREAGGRPAGGVEAPFLTPEQLKPSIPDPPFGTEQDEIQTRIDGADEPPTSWDERR